MQFQRVFPRSNNRKLVCADVQTSAAHHVSGIGCSGVAEGHILLQFLDMEQFKSLDIVGNHATDSGKNLQSILTSAKNFLQVLRNHLCPCAVTSKVVSDWFVPTFYVGYRS
jgi:hypothetical protein